MKLNAFMFRYIVNDIDVAVRFCTSHLAFGVAFDRVLISLSSSETGSSSC